MGFGSISSDVTGDCRIELMVNDAYGYLSRWNGLAEARDRCCSNSDFLCFCETHGKYGERGLAW
ncbi:unnamed protein product [Rhodiola kirilowii]